MFYRELLIPLLNPFSEEAKKIVQSSPPLYSLPPELVQEALNRVSRPVPSLFTDKKLVEREVLSFYLACAGVASVSHPYSSEARLLENAVKVTIKGRMFELFKKGYEDCCLEAVRSFIKIEPILGRTIRGKEIPEKDYFKLRDRELQRLGLLGKEVDERVLLQCIPKYAIRWTDLSPLLEHNRLRLSDLYLVEGWAAISPSELWHLYSEFIAVKTEEYLEDVQEKLSQVKPPPLFVEVGTKISQLVPKEKEWKLVAVKRGKLKPEFFPPCIKKTLQGCPAGIRNFAVSFLLTSFLSYARISPSGKPDPRIKDFVEDLSVLTDEIIPMIYEAAERCHPPLFSDQPQEKANIWYHLGFGLTEHPKLEDSGKSKWYRTPNCQKIKIQAPALCEPDEYCAHIKNPLTYYYRRLVEAKHAVQRSNTGGEEDLL
jgi:DNA primase large subunit